MFISQVINQNVVPPLFAAIIITNFCLIVIDRAVYISKSIVAKILLQVVTVISFNMWLFFVLPPTNKFAWCLFFSSTSTFKA